jgi:hypothetical protein
VPAVHPHRMDREKIKVQINDKERIFIFKIIYSSRDIVNG